MTSNVIVRSALRADVPAIVRMLADDMLGAKRERVDDLPAYLRAFDAVVEDPGNELLVAVKDGEVIGCLQLTMIPGMSRVGMRRAQIESVRVSSTHRGARVGEQLVLDAVARARAAGCGMLQLTSDASRVDARRFYERLGFEASHIGMKLTLSQD
jgi:ribosomal protein S18 acetylase RimI-like enzyme